MKVTCQINQTTLKPVFVTFDDEKEFLDANNLTIAKIKAETIQLMDQFEDQHLADMYRNIHKTIMKSKKEKHIQFYNEL